MSVATIGAFITKEYLEGVLVMLLYQIENYFKVTQLINQENQLLV